MTLDSQVIMVYHSAGEMGLTPMTNLSILRKAIPSSVYEVASSGFSAARNEKGSILVISIGVDGVL